MLNNNKNEQTLFKEHIRKRVESNLNELNEKINASCAKVRRSPSEITLIAVTKTVPVDKIEAALDSGIKIIGENRVQEALEKYPKIQNRAEWHLIGHLQTNKVKKAIEIFSMIQSVDSLYLSQEIEKRTGIIGKVMPVLIEVNTSQEETKFGVQSGQLFDLIKDMLELPHLKISGLMTIGPGLAVEDKEKSRPCFRLLYELAEKVKAEFKIPILCLSMGMSSDFEVGIEEGSNMIRIGTAIFGERTKH